MAVSSAGWLVPSSKLCLCILAQFAESKSGQRVWNRALFPGASTESALGSKKPSAVRSIVSRPWVLWKKQMTETYVNIGVTVALGCVWLTIVPRQCPLSLSHLLQQGRTELARLSRLPFFLLALLLVGPRNPKCRR